MAYSRRNRRRGGISRRNRNRKNRRMTRRWANRKMRGGLSNSSLIEADDPNQFATYYTVKYGKEHGSITPIDVQPNSVLVVVDMQNDFVDRRVDGLTGPGGIGAFSVTGGKNCIDKIIQWVDKNKSNLSKIILTRDWHHPEHCSFKLFPPHCTFNSLGADIVEEIKQKVTCTETGCLWDDTIPADVIFKGFHQNTDSFGAAQYNDPEYLKKRQVAKCCQNGSCSDKTGGSSLKKEYISKSIEKDVFDANDNLHDDNLHEKYFNNYFWTEQIKDNSDIYVVGLAGDYCVKDTALNIKKLLIDKENVNVNVIQDLTRYAFVPAGAIKFSSIEDVKKDNSNKPLTDYIFKFQDNKYKALQKDELDELTNLSDINTFQYWHFLSDQKQLIKDYNDNGIKLVYLPGGEVETIINIIKAESPTET